MPAAQVLLTHSDLAERDRYLNARAAIEALFEFGAVPVINENDTVAVDEIKFGDNDQLAAMVASLVGADLLVLLTDVDGLLDGANERVPVVHDFAEVEALIRPDIGEGARGGMRSKVEAARRATRRGIPVIVGPANDPEIIAKCVRGEDVGTLFLPDGSRMASWKHWIAYTPKLRGAVVVDQGAVQALVVEKRSLLPAGVLGIRGEFGAGDPVAIMGPDGAEIARGLARYGSRDAALLAGAQTHEIEARIGRGGGEEIVHRNDLVFP
jgi:glutamate 5-kinase